MKLKGVETTMIGNTIEYIMNDIRSITENVIIKYSNEAEKYENIDSQREADKFVAASTERDLFGSYYHYDMDALAKAGITNLNDLNKYYEDKWSIPYKKRDLVLKYQREIVINEYEERNDYYRLLIGKPPINTPEEEFIYLTEEQMKYYKIDEVRPLHEYPQEIQIKLERTVIPELIALYPDREYLKHMGSKAVNLIRAREAKNFEIIFTDVVLDNVFLRSFFETYDFCREYFMSTIYNKTISGRYDLYDNYIAMCIMIMTIQRLVVDTIQTAIHRDFYDIANLKKFFDCYGVPFFEELPLDYQRMIVKNMNMLIRRKSTDMCLYDISNVLMLNNVNIYKYYLVRERILDDNGEPLILYKTELDDYGNEVEVLDYESMYKFYFQSIDIYEPNVTVAIENKANKYHYNEVTDEDVHWWEDDDLLKEKYERQYNYIETKYLGINIMQNLTKLMYDTCYFIHLLVDNKDTTTPMETRILNTDAMKTGTDYIYLQLDRFTPVPVSIFDAVVIMILSLSISSPSLTYLLANSSLNAALPSVPPYCRALAPSSSSTSIIIVLRSSIGKVAGFGKPPANEITPGWFTTPSKALIGDGFIPFALLERNSLKSTFISVGFKSNTICYYKYNKIKNMTISYWINYKQKPINTDKKQAQGHLCLRDKLCVDL